MKRRFTLARIISIMMMLPTIINYSNAQECEDVVISSGNKFPTANYFFEEGNYLKALYEYDKILLQNDDDVWLNYRIGECCMHTCMYDKALIHYQKVFHKDSLWQDIHFKLGMAYQLNGQFERAISSLTNFITIQGDENVSDAYKHFKECEFALRLEADSSVIKLFHAGLNVNSVFPEYRPVRFGDVELFFTSRRKQMPYEVADPKDNSYYETPIKLLRRKGIFTPSKINARAKLVLKHNTILYISPKGNALFYRGDEGNGDIYMSKYAKGKFGKMIAFSAINSPFRETSAVFSPSEDTVYFISDRPNISLGGKDVLYCVKQSNGMWSEPIQPGPSINTPSDEEGVGMSPSGNKLYFSSKGHLTMGGFDIFESTKDSSGQWSAVKNLGLPFNSPADDIFYTEGNDGMAWFSSNRIGSFGSYDIYNAEVDIPELLIENPLQSEISVETELDSLETTPFEIHSRKENFTEISVEISGGGKESKGISIELRNPGIFILPINDDVEINVLIEDDKKP